MPVFARHVVCLLGQLDSFDDLERVALEVGGRGFSIDREYSILEPDDRMERSFEVAADRTSPSMLDSDWDAIRSHRAVAYVLSPPMERAAARATSKRMLDVVAAAFEVGASAAKSESSGIAHGRARWLELAGRCASSDPTEATFASLDAWVRRPLVDRSVYYSCGMHLLGEPDVEIASPRDDGEVRSWMDALAAYLLAERPLGGVGDGDTFRRVDSDPRHRITGGPCTRYASDDFFFNPQGYLRIDLGAMLH